MVLGFVRLLRARGGAHFLRVALGLERLEGPQRAPELGERAAAIAQQRVEAARAVAVADEGEPEAAAGKVVLGEQLRLEPLGPGETPGGGDDPLREHGLQRALRRQLLHQCSLERGKLGGTLARQHDALLRAQTVLQRVLRRARLAFRRLRTFRPGTVFPAGLGAGAGQAKAWHDKFLR